MIHKVTRRLVLPLLIGLGAAGCMVGPDFQRPDSDIQESWLNEEDERFRDAPGDFDEWWQTFNDPSLTALIEEANANSLTLRIAGLRVYEARALLGRVRGSLYPQVQSASVGFTATELSENTELFEILPDSVADQLDGTFENYGVGIDAVWELDFWGRFRRGIEAADSNLERTIADFGHVRITLQGEVASAYVLLRTLQELLAISRENVAVQERSLQIASVRFRNGLTTELDVQQATALLRDTQSLIPELEASLRQTRNALSLLLGRAPSELDDVLTTADGRVPATPQTLDIGVPSELLRRRPDVRRAEMLAASQSALIGVAKADMYPAFRLAGSVGYAAGSTGDLFESDSVAALGSFGFMWKFLNYGRLRNLVRAQDARFEQSLAGYQLTVIAAAKEAEDALDGYLGNQDQELLKRDSVAAAERAVELALVQYRDGVTNYTTVLDTQRFQLQQQSSHVQTRGQVANSLIEAYKALGGGWDPAYTGDFVPAGTLDEMRERTNWGDMLAPQQP